jgi:hypothetical protein
VGQERAAERLVKDAGASSRSAELRDAGAHRAAGREGRASPVHLETQAWQHERAAREAEHALLYGNLSPRKAAQADRTIREHLAAAARARQASVDEGHQAVREVIARGNYRIKPQHGTLMVYEGGVLMGEYRPPPGEARQGATGRRYAVRPKPLAPEAARARAQEVERARNAVAARGAPPKHAAWVMRFGAPALAHVIAGSPHAVAHYENGAFSVSHRGTGLRLARNLSLAQAERLTRGVGAGRALERAMAGDARAMAAMRRYQRMITETK